MLSLWKNFILIFGLILCLSHSGVGYSNERPTIVFNGSKYYLVNFYRIASKTVETYIPENETLSNFTSQIERVELHDINNIKAAADGLAFQYDNRHLPYKLIKQDPEPILIGTYFSPMHTVVLDKEIFIFKRFPKSKRVVYYSFLKREFVEPHTEATKMLKKDPKLLLMDDKYIDLIKQLKID